MPNAVVAVAVHSFIFDAVSIAEIIQLRM